MSKLAVTFYGRDPQGGVMVVQGKVVEGRMEDAGDVVGPTNSAGNADGRIGTSGKFSRKF